MFDPHGIVITANQQMYVADTRNHTVRKIDLKTGSFRPWRVPAKRAIRVTVALATKAEFNGTFAIDVDPAGRNLYVADLGNRRIRKIDLKSGIVTTIAGNGEKGVPQDGADASSQPARRPARGGSGFEGQCLRLRARRQCLACCGYEGKDSDVDRSSQQALPLPTKVEPDLNGPKHLCVDRNDNVIIADAENNLIRKYDPRAAKTVNHCRNRKTRPRNCRR